MTLIVTARHRSDDLQRWEDWERVDAVIARRLGARLARRAEAALEVMRRFIRAGDGYLGISWGKDSVVCAHLLHLLETEGAAFPAAWVRVDGWENPDCVLVRDAFLERWPLCHYAEVHAAPGANRAGGTSAPGFEEAARRFGDRHISGVRGEESARRGMAMARYGDATTRTCRPIGRWSTEEVFAYLWTHDLPVHPAYGYSMGGAYDRNNLRVGSLGGDRGTGHGRREWEDAYYPESRVLL